jgi:hypothetical protein
VFICPVFPKGVRTAAANLEAVLRASSHNKTIDFYGKLIDQNGDPVVEANVQMRYAEYSALELARGEAFARHNLPVLTTDANGMFSLHLGGEYLQLMDIQKSGYLFKGYPDKVYQWYYDEKIAPPTADKNSPIIFQAWKIPDKPERLRDLNMDHVGIRVLIPDQTVSIYLGGTTQRAACVAGKKEDADFYVTVWYGPEKPTAAVGRTIRDWSYKIEVPDGGLIKTNDAFPYLAPQDGYKGDYSFTARTSDPSWTSEQSDLFYIKSRNGQLYGAVRVDLRAGGGAAIGVSGMVNPMGSRYLGPGGEFYNR